jgi:ABC-type polar amino acid transport system ATPase subunit
MLHVTNLCKTFGTRHILNHIGLSVQYGDVGILLGGSGAGKSTLLRCIAQLDICQEGTIMIDGRPLVAADVGMVFQQFNLFENLTVRENIIFSLRWGHRRLTSVAAQDLAQKMLVQFGLTDVANSYPRYLSGGQKQRVALARTLALEPKIVCLDEPTSALDPLLTHQVAQLINNIASLGYIVLVATHDISLVKKLQGILWLMQDGKIIESASTQDYAASPASFAHLQDFLQFDGE